jgi:hypothetical protein
LNHHGFILISTFLLIFRLFHGSVVRVNASI